MKRYNLLGLLFVFISLFVLASCNENTQETNDKYKITYENGDWYQINNLADEAMAGDKVYFDINVTSVFYEINEVHANEEKINKGNLGWSFTMPEQDVTITVSGKDVGEYNDENDKLDWASNVTGFISAPKESDKNVSWDVEQEINLSFVGISQSNYISQVKSIIYSSNESVIPQNAITFEPIKASQSNIIIGGKLVINLKLISQGETYIYVKLDPNNSSLGTLIKKFTVVEYGKLELESFDVTLKIDNNSNYDNSELYLNISDRNYVYGSTENQVQTFYLNEIENNTITFKYFVNHNYFLSCGINDGSGNSITIEDWVGSGSSTTGFNQLIDNLLTIITPNTEVEIVITD